MAHARGPDHPTREDRRALQAARRPVATSALTVSVWLLVCVASPAWGRPARGARDAAPSLRDGRLVLPAWETAWERQQLRQKDAQGQLDAFRAAHPELYGATTAPLQPVRHYAEWDPVDAVYYAWEPGTFDAFFAEITHQLLTQSAVTLYILHHGAADRGSLEALIAAEGDDPADASFIDVAGLGPYYVWQTEWPYDRSIESFWTVDFGPYFVLDGADTLGIVDPRYYPWRVNDDAVPAKLGALQGLTVWRPDLDWEGGNLFSDGQGTCFTTRMHIAENLPQTQAEVEQQLFEYFGCEKVFWLHVLHGEGTGHIDMFFKPASPTLLLLGEYDAAEDPVNAERLEWNAALLEGATNAAGDPFEVRRFPMPRNDDDVWRSYANGIVVNDLLLVPTYATDRTQEAATLVAFGDAFPGRTVVSVDSDDIIEWGGAIHCVTRTRPAATRQPITPAPGPACGGAARCTTGCGELDYTGDCLDGLSVYCEAGEVVVEACYYDERCGWDLTDDFVYCVTAGCGDLPAEGECRTSADDVTAAVTCVDGYPNMERCAAGEPCEIQQDTGLVGCGASCANECERRTTGCVDDQHVWTCGEAGDGDLCTERLVTPCGADERCRDATCVPAGELPKEKGGCGCAASGGAGGLALPGLILLLCGLLWRRRHTRAPGAGPRESDR